MSARSKPLFGICICYRILCLGWICSIAFHLTSWLPHSVAVADDAGEASGQAEEFRTFTNLEGQSVEACLLSYFDGNAKIKPKDGGAITTLTANSLSTSDQQYIEEWARTHTS